MKRVILFLLLATFEAPAAFGQRLVITSTYEPLTYEEIAMAVQSERARIAWACERYEEYRELAYEYYLKDDYVNFIRCSDIALSVNVYSRGVRSNIQGLGQLYYDRGDVFEQFHDYKSAKREYKLAKREGLSRAKYALQECKENEREWKRSQKKKKR